MRDVTALIASEAFSCDGLEVVRLVGRERISTPYEVDVDLVARKDGAPSAEAIVGSAVSIAFASEGTLERIIPGLVASAVDFLDPASGLRSYRLRVVPWLYELSQVSLQEIYQGTIPEILAKKFKACDVDFELRLSGFYREHDYLAQFGETDLAFVSRLAEQTGISYSFERRGDHECVVLTDDNRFQDARQELKVPYRSRGELCDVFRLEAAASLAPTLVLVGDYNYRAPQPLLSGSYELPKGTGGGTIEFGGHLRTEEEATSLAKIRGEELECRRFQYRGESDRPELAAGLMFTLTDHPYLGDVELLVVEVEHAIEQPARGTGTGALAYSNRFRAIPAATPHRPERVTPVPKVAGLRGGVVLPMPGGSDTQPWIDEAGRYRVRLFFDTLGGRQGGGASRPMRLVQAHAGPGYGIHFPLRPGTEVIVGFINGNVDRPILLGAAPNTVSESPVTDKSALHHRIRTSSGVTLEFEDGS